MRRVIHCYTTGCSRCVRRSADRFHSPAAVSAFKVPTIQNIQKTVDVLQVQFFDQDLDLGDNSIAASVDIPDKPLEVAESLEVGLVD